ncbi:type II toxin-antitoxin system VapC family toxin [Fodinicola feengrottensis]|uniref:Ribonuclease VapC n=1 Tax=Fodinicola feengrottensis TaxID=435914 RepID=A0ABP4S9I4_9ACTN|nr:type II toxin-antitoxin system VapC family toxin [Fodinicola feengrottensis]
MIGSRGLIDTNIVIHLPRLKPAELPAELVISAVTLAELSAGPHHALDPIERARRVNILQRAESTFHPLPFDGPAARAFGQVCAAELTAGRKPPRRIADLMIASIALANRLPLYTTNADDFSALTDLIEIVAISRPN